MQEEDNFDAIPLPEICLALSMFEHRRIAMRRIYMFQYDDLNRTSHLMTHREFLNQINSLVLAENNHEFPCAIKAKKIQIKLEALFGSFTEDLLDVDPSSDRQNARNAPRTFKKYVAYFNNQIENLMQLLLPAEFQCLAKVCLTPSQEITDPFLVCLRSLSSIGDQELFCQDPENIEAVILLARENPKFHEFCTTPEMMAYWECILQNVHDEIITFLIDSYSQQKVQKVDAFTAVQLLYLLQIDLSNISTRTTNILVNSLPAFEQRNPYQTFCTLLNAKSEIEEQQNQVLNSLCFVQCLVDSTAFYNRTELDFQTKPSSNRKSFFDDIQNKSFDWLMQSLFRSYTQLIMDYYEFVGLNFQLNAQCMVFKELASVKTLQISPLRATYRDKIVGIQKFGSLFNEIDTNFQKAIVDFLISTRDFYPFDSDVKDEEFDEDTLAHVLNTISNPNFTQDIKKSVVVDFKEYLQNLLPSFENLSKHYHQIKSFRLRQEHKDSFEQQLLQTGMRLLQQTLTQQTQTANSLHNKIENIIANLDIIAQISIEPKLGI